MVQANRGRYGIAIRKKAAQAEDLSVGNLPFLRYQPQSDPSVEVAIEKGTASSIVPDRVATQTAIFSSRFGGALPFYLNQESMNPFIASVLGGEESIVDISALTANSVSVAGASTLTRSSGSFITDGVVENSYLRLTGMTDPTDDGIVLVTAVTELAITVAATFNSSDVSQTINFTGSHIENGLGDGGFYAIERQYTNIGIYSLFKTAVVSNMTLEWSPSSFVTGAVTFIGLDQATETATPVTSDYSDMPMRESYLTSIHGNSFVLESSSTGVLSAQATALSLTIDPNAAPIEGAFNNGELHGVAFGLINPTGTLTLRKTNVINVLNKINTNERLQMSFRMTLPSGVTKIIRFFGITLDGYEDTGDGAIFVSVPITCLGDDNKRIMAVDTV